MHRFSASAARQLSELGVQVVAHKAEVVFFGADAAGSVEPGSCMARGNAQISELTRRLQQPRRAEDLRRVDQRGRRESPPRCTGVTLPNSDKDGLVSEERVERVGDKLKARLLRNFGSLKRVSEASFDELKPFVGTREAKRIVEHFAQIRDSDLVPSDGAQPEH